MSTCAPATAAGHTKSEKDYYLTQTTPHSDGMQAQEQQTIQQPRERFVALRYASDVHDIAIGAQPIHVRHLRMSLTETTLPCAQ